MLTINEMEDLKVKYSLELTDDDHISAKTTKKDQAALTKIMKEHKPQIIDYLKSLEAEKEKAKAARDKWLDDNGVYDIESCLRAWSDYRRAFNAEFENEDGFIKPPKKPDCNIDELKARYPAGYAYIQADNNSFSANYAKAGIYKRAKAAILSGEDYKSVMEKAEKEWDKHVEDHMWD